MRDFIDIHAVCTLDRMPPVCGRHEVGDVSDALALYDALGVERGVIMPVANAECFATSQSNEEALQIARAHPDRFAAFCNVDPRNFYNSPRANLAPVMEHYRKRGCRGVGCVCAKLPLTDARVQNLFDCAAQANMPVAVRLDGNMDAGCGLYASGGLPELDALLARLPSLKVFATGAAFWCEISEKVDREARIGLPSGKVKEGVLARMMRGRPNLLCDLSGPWGANALARDRAYAAKFLSEFRDRVYFGLGAVSPEAGKPPLPSLLRELAATGAIGRDVFAAVACGNAERFLKGGLE